MLMRKNEREAIADRVIGAYFRERIADAGGDSKAVIDAFVRDHEDYRVCDTHELRRFAEAMVREYKVSV